MEESTTIDLVYGCVLLVIERLWQRCRRSQQLLEQNADITAAVGNEAAGTASHCKTSTRVSSSGGCDGT